MQIPASGLLGFVVANTRSKAHTEKVLCIFMALQSNNDAYEQIQI